MEIRFTRQTENRARRAVEWFVLSVLVAALLYEFGVVARMSGTQFFIILGGVLVGIAGLGFLGFLVAWLAGDISFCSEENDE